MVNESREGANVKNMSVEEKIAQTLFVRGDSFHQGYRDMGIGGYFLDKHNISDSYSGTIEKYKESSIVPFFATDMEGAWNPFSKFYKSKVLGEIRNFDEAYELGVSHGEILEQIGFDANFSPVVETKNNVWPGRSFTGTSAEVGEKISGYIQGLQSVGIMATAKHYPGGTMKKNPHYASFAPGDEDFEKGMFDVAMDNDVAMIMVGHPIVNGRTASTSKEVIGELKEKYNGIVITDDISMRGLVNNYPFNKKIMLEDLVGAGNDMILWTGFMPINRPTPKKIEKYIGHLSHLVRGGDLSESEIDKSVRKILEAKRYWISD